MKNAIYYVYNLRIRRIFVNMTEPRVSAYNFNKEGNNWTA